MNNIKEFWQQLVDKQPKVKSCNSQRDNDIIKQYLSNHVESEGCVFHSNQQTFLVEKKSCAENE